MKSIVKSLFLVFIVTCFITGQSNAQERYFAKTPANAIQIKTLPSVKVLEAPVDTTSFPKSAIQTFNTLKNYIQKYSLQMVTPVNLNFEQARMLFYITSPKAQQQLTNSKEVVVKTLPERTVVSIGLQGQYSQKNYNSGRYKLTQWIASHNEWQSAGSAYVVYWNNPYLPGNLKHSEVHIPVRKSQLTARH